MLALLRAGRRVRQDWVGGNLFKQKPRPGASAPPTWENTALSLKPTDTLPGPSQIRAPAAARGGIPSMGNGAMPATLRSPGPGIFTG